MLVVVEILRLTSDRIFLRLPTLQARSDIARYEILYSQGGLYIDCDLRWLGIDGFQGSPAEHIPTQQFISMIDNIQYLGISPHYMANSWDVDMNSRVFFYFANGVLVSPIESPVLQMVISKLPNHVDKALSADIDMPFIQTGPELLNRIIAILGFPVTIIPPNWIFSHDPKNASDPDLESIAKFGVMWGEFKGFIRRKREKRKKYLETTSMTTTLQAKRKGFWRDHIPKILKPFDGRSRGPRRGRPVPSLKSQK